MRVFCSIGFSFFFCLPEKIPLPRKEAPSTSFYNRTAPMNERDGSTTFRVKLSAPEFLFPAVDLLPGISSSHNSPNSQSVQFFRVRYPFSISGCVVSSCTLKGVVGDFCQVGTDGPDPTHPSVRSSCPHSFPSSSSPPPLPNFFFGGQLLSGRKERSVHFLPQGYIWD